MPPSGAWGGPWSAERIGWNLFRAPGAEYSGTRAQGGALAVDDAEFRELFASEYARLCWLGFLLTGSGAEGEELAQEALVRMWWRWRLGRRPARPAEVVPPADSERSMVLWEAVQALPPRQRAVLVLRYKEDLTEAEVARLLGLPVGAVKSASHRALARLRQRLGSFDLDPAGSTT